MPNAGPGRPDRYCDTAAQSQQMLIREFITPRVVAVAAHASIADAAKLMLENKISGLPVIASTRHVVGIVSEHDLLRRREGDKGKPRSHWLRLMIERTGLREEWARFHDRRVNDIMTPSPITISPTSSLEEACRIIKERGIKRLPVVENGELVGIIARADVVRALAQATGGTARAPLRNESVNGRLRELERQILRNRARGPKPF